ncbi:MAG: ImmA/IrrE family metallo-endopeptidase [Beijerinckiaceae bacterium]
MTDTQQFTPDWFSKPGDSVLALMHRRNVKVHDLANAFRGGMNTVRGLFAGSTAIDHDLADALAKTLGGTANFWLKRQANYERALDRVLSDVIETEAEEWLGRVPPPPGSGAGARLTEARRREEVRRRLVFFNVNNFRVWNARYGCLRSETQFRTSPTLLSNDGAVATWLRQGELEAALISQNPWNPDALRERLDDVRKLTRVSHPARFLPKLKQLCAEAGVALVVVRAPNGCRASGATKLIGPDRAMVLLSFRFRADDQFWFTVFHEFGHLLLHGAKTFVDDEETVEDEREREANEFASNCIIPMARQAEFERLPPKREAILRFSVSIGVAPGLVVGQMQHRNVIGHERLNTLKRHWTWSQIEPALN